MEPIAPSPPELTPGASAPAPTIGTLGELRASGHRQLHLRQELRENLLAALPEGRDPWPGIHGFEDTVIPQLERALIAGHDVVLLGERGQGKTRLLRSLVGLLDEWTPVIAGLRAAASTRTSRSRARRGAAPPSSATTCRWRGGTATSGTPRSSPPPTPASPT